MKSTSSPPHQGAQQAAPKHCGGFAAQVEAEALAAEEQREQRRAQPLLGARVGCSKL